jgi:uncharacterized protein (DUF433 family)
MTDESKADFIRSFRGKYSYIQTSSDKFAQSKQEEIDWEDKSMTTNIVDIGTLIVRDPDICGDRPRIAGTRMTVGRVGTLWKQGLDGEQILHEYPHLKLEQIYAALAYYHANREQIDKSLSQDREDYDRLYAEHLAMKGEN